MVALVEKRPHKHLWDCLGMHRELTTVLENIFAKQWSEQRGKEFEVTWCFELFLHSFRATTNANLQLLLDMALKQFPVRADILFKNQKEQQENPRNYARVKPAKYSRTSEI